MFAPRISKRSRCGLRPTSEVTKSSQSYYSICSAPSGSLWVIAIVVTLSLSRLGRRPLLQDKALWLHLYVETNCQSSFNVVPSNVGSQEHLPISGTPSFDYRCFLACCYFNDLFWENVPLYVGSQEHLPISGTPSFDYRCFLACCYFNPLNTELNPICQ